jgi:integrase
MAANPEHLVSQREWLIRAKTAVGSLATTLMSGEAALVRSVFRRMARIVRKTSGAEIALPLRFTPSQMRPLLRLRDPSSPSTHAWEDAMERVFEALRAIGLLRPPHSFSVRRERRALAVVLDPEAFALLPALHRLREQVLQAPSGPEHERQDAGLVRAVLGTVAFSGITLPHLRETLARVDECALDLDAGCLILPVRPLASGRHAAMASWRRFPLDTQSVLLWGRPLLAIRREPLKRGPQNYPLLPGAWTDPLRLRKAVRQALQKMGFPSWRLFLKTARLDALLASLPPVSVARRAGRVVAGAAFSADLRRLGWNLAEDGPISPSDQSPQLAGTVTGRVTARSPVRERVGSIVTALNGDVSLDERHRLADDLEHLLGRPSERDRVAWIDAQVAAWAVHLLRARRYRPKTVRTWLSRAGRFLDALATPLSPDDLQDGDRLATALRLGISACRSAESQKTMRTALRQLLLFLGKQGLRVARINWRSPGLLVIGQPRLTSLVTPAEIHAVAEVLLRDGQADALSLATAIVLAGFGGLRRIEMCRLRMIDVPRDRRWSVCIRRSKTAAGKRFVALGPIAPPWAMDILERYSTDRVAQQHDPESYWLLNQAGMPWNPDDLASRITAALRSVSSTRATLHSLRRAAATWLCVYWLASATDLHLPEEITAFGFRLEGVRELLGPDPTAALWSLAKFLGHRSPAVTLGHYMLALDWIETQLMHAAPTQPVPVRFAEATLQLSARRVRQLLPTSRGAVPADLLALEVRERLARQARAAEGGASPERVLLSRAVPSAPDAAKSAASPCASREPTEAGT